MFSLDNLELESEIFRKLELSVKVDDSVYEEVMCKMRNMNSQKSDNEISDELEADIEICYLQY